MTRDPAVELVHGVTVYFYPADAPIVGSEGQASEVLATAFGHRAALVAMPVDRLDDMFFHLSTRIAGDILQKFVNHRVQLAILGDLDSHLRTSAALRDFVAESNRGTHVWFLRDRPALEARLAARPASGSATTSG
ncbi:DUF4180 domain-containing protein [Galbitalea soli]|uniref:DUF4180 domain-containing protein n=1 Tax=Galbitalea soli TaxID=1268042 RepID=A0A7C9TSM7_9MICO|nr:DUF4180 domain-containing protein [Galbitalea soli]NEM91944.1 DUF4180 domain-containing protein [Galbitalea soli]NYJ32108.1 hypothetical protein [Galbitalea soli]